MLDLDSVVQRVATRLCQLNVLNPCHEQPCEQHLAQAGIMAEAIEEILPDRSGEKIWSAYPEIWKKRSLFFLEHHSDGYGGLTPGSRTMVDGPEEANLVGSRAKGPWNDHYPAIDIDLPVLAYPSATPGHSHLFVEKKLKWKVYRELLKALVTAGIVEENYYQATLKEEQSYIYLPGKGRPPRPRRFSTSHY